MNYKTMIVPIIAVIAMAVQLVFGIEIGQEVQEQIAGAIANLVAVGFIVYGIVKNHKKEGEK